MAGEEGEGRPRASRNYETGQGIGIRERKLRPSEVAGKPGHGSTTETEIGGCTRVHRVDVLGTHARGREIRWGTGEWQRGEGAGKMESKRGREITSNGIVCRLGGLRAPN